MASRVKPRKRTRGELEELPSGSIRVRVYAGIDPVTKKRYHLTEVVPAGSQAYKEAEKVRTRLLNQVDEKRSPRTKATVGELLDRHLKELHIEETTWVGYETMVRNHVRPLIGHIPLAKVDGEVLDSFYRQLRTCRRHCQGAVLVDHRTAQLHECNDRCEPHTCRPLAANSLRNIRSVLSGAGKRAKRWGWVGVNPFELAEPMPAGKPDPQPPTAEQAARIAMAAWREPDWGLLVWMAMVTGARRGELCALKWDSVDLASGVLTIRSSIAQKGGRTWEKDTKQHQQRRITLDDQTTALLRAYRRQRAVDAELGEEMPAETRVFSPAPDGIEWIKPDTVTQRYARMCKRLGWDMHIHQLRHYSATELIACGVDVRTVAGRLGHGGGGTTTLKVYSAWVAEADQRAAGSLAGRLPELPVTVVEGDVIAAPTSLSDEERAPYLRIAADLQGAITSGVLVAGGQLPTAAELRHRYDASAGTVNRAIALLKEGGFVTASRGRRAVVAEQA